VRADDLLNECLEAVAAGRRTPAECAALYPGVKDLEAQLRAALALRAWSLPRLSPAAQTRHQAQLRAALRGRTSPTRPHSRTPALFRRAAVALAALLLLVLAGVGTAQVAEASLPGEALYPVKRGVEAMRLGLTPPSERAALHTELADRRAEELLALAVQGAADAALISEAASDLEAETAAALAGVGAARADRQAELLEHIVVLTVRQQAVLETVRTRVPEQARQGIDRALEASRTHRARAQERLKAAKGRSGAPNATSVPASAGASQTPGARSTPAPPGKARKTQTAAPSPMPATQPVDAATQAATEAPAGNPSDVPPGQARKTQTARPNCSASSPNSPNYCTPTP
jgi:hypothetical protein